MLTALGAILDVVELHYFWMEPLSAIYTGGGLENMNKLFPRPTSCWLGLLGVFTVLGGLVGSRLEVIADVFGIASFALGLVAGSSAEIGLSVFVGLAVKTFHG